MRLFQNATYVALGNRDLGDSVRLAGRVPWWREAEIAGGARRVRADVVPLLALELRCQQGLSRNPAPHLWVEERRAGVVRMCV
jgi:hypothetical protein